MTDRVLDGGGGVEDGRDPAEASTPPRPPTYPTIAQARSMLGITAPAAHVYRKALDILNKDADERRAA